MNIVLLSFLFFISGNVFADTQLSYTAECQKSAVLDLLNKPKYIYSFLSNKKGVLRLDLCGQVLAPMPFSVNQLRRFKSYKEINSFIDSVQVTADIIDVQLGVLGYNFKLKLKFEKQNNQKLLFKVMSSPFLGMKIGVKVVDLQRRRSLVVMNAIYEYNELSVPKMVLETGVKTAAIQLARNMQQWIESEYAKQKESNTGGK